MMLRLLRGNLAEVPCDGLVANSTTRSAILV